MNYEYSLIHVSDQIESGKDSYSVSLVDAHGLTFSLNGLSAFLSGKYVIFAKIF